MSPADQRLWSTLVHLSTVFWPVVGGLIGYLVLKDRGGFVREHTATALNFQITMAIAYVVSWVLMFVVVGIFLMLAILVVSVVFMILAAMAANAGQPYKYPLAFEFVR